MKVIILDKEEEEIKMAVIELYFILHLFLILYISINFLINLIYIKIINKIKIKILFTFLFLVDYIHLPNVLLFHN